MIQLRPAPVVGGNLVAGSVTLNTPAPTGGTTVTIATSSIDVAPLQNNVPGAASAAASVNVVVPAGQTIAAFRIGTVGVTTVATVTISAVVSGEAASASLIVLPASVASVTLNSTIVTGGQTVSATVNLDGRAPPSASLPVTVSASSNVGPVFSTSTSPAVATVSAPPTVTVAPGTSSVSFQVTTTPVSAAATGLITASLGRSASASFNLLPPTPSVVQFNPSTLIGGTPSTGTVVLNGKAPSGGLAVGLTSSSASLTLPSIVSVPQGTDRQTFNVSTTPVGSSVRASVVARSTSAEREAAVNTSTGVTGILTIDPGPSPTAIQLNPTFVIGGKNLTGTVLLTGPATASGVAVLLSSSSADATVPTSITVPAGLDRQSFQITTRSVASSHGVEITARGLGAGTSSTIADGTSNTVQLSESPAVRAVLGILEQPRVQSVVVQPSAVSGGSPATVTVKFTTTSNSLLSAEQMAGYARSIALVANPSGLLQVPATFSVSGSGTGTLTGTATVATTVPSSDQTVSLTAVMFTSSIATSFIIRAPVPPIASFALQPTKVAGGSSFVGALQLSAGTMTSQTVQLGTDRPALVKIPASVLVLPGQTLSFSGATTAVTSQTTVTITASVGSQKVTVTLLLMP